VNVALRTRLDAARDRARSIRRQMIALQEELDWRCYRLYGLLEAPLETEHPPEIDLGERAFEIVLARRVARGELETAWFSRHGSTPITEIPARWPEDYRRLVERRIALIESDRNIGLVERPEYKRRWSWTPWEEQERDAQRGWLLDRLEGIFSGASPAEPGSARGSPSSRARLSEPRLTSTARLADQIHTDAELLEVAGLYAGRVDFDLAALVAELVESETVPFLPALRYSESGLRKRVQWEDTWTLQRKEDAIDAEVEAEPRARAGGALAGMPALESARGAPPTSGGGAGGSGALAAIPQQPLAPESARGAPPTGRGGIPPGPPADGGHAQADALAAEQRRRKHAEVGDIPVPPKYRSTDFLKNTFWRLRGGLDVPRERFVSYPGCERDADRSPLIAWAGWNVLQQAMAVATYYLDMKEREGWPAERLTPLLAGIQELLPWVLQWHNDYDPDSGQRMGDYFASFLTEEVRVLGLPLDALRAWRPAAQSAARRGRKPKGTV